MTQDRKWWHQGRENESFREVDTHDKYYLFSSFALGSQL